MKKHEKDHYAAIKFGTDIITDGKKINPQKIISQAKTESGRQRIFFQRFMLKRKPIQRYFLTIHNGTMVIWLAKRKNIYPSETLLIPAVLPPSWKKMDNIYDITDMRGPESWTREFLKQIKGFHSGTVGKWILQNN